MSTENQPPSIVIPENAHVVTSIDASINSLGYAIFVNKRLTTFATIKASDEDKKYPMPFRIAKMMFELAKQMPSSKYKQTVVIEDPEMFGGAVSNAAVHNSSLKKLIMIVGAIIYHTFLLKAECVLVPVTTWKGQLPKHITKQRMEKKYGVTTRTTDECDAIGIGDWYIENATPKVDVT